MTTLTTMAKARGKAAPHVPFSWSSCAPGPALSALLALLLADCLPAVPEKSLCPCSDGYYCCATIGRCYDANEPCPPPEIIVTLGPPSFTQARDATFSFELTGVSAPHAVVNTTCRLDDVEQASCRSPVTFTDLSTGEHVFFVWATDEGGNTTETPARHAFHVDTVAMELLRPGSSHPLVDAPSTTLVRWRIDVPDSVSVTGYDIDLSVDDGMTFLYPVARGVDSETLCSSVTSECTYHWNVARERFSHRARLRVTAWLFGGESVSATNASPFSIGFYEPFENSGTSRMPGELQHPYGTRFQWHVIPFDSSIVHAYRWPYTYNTDEEDDPLGYALHTLTAARIQVPALSGHSMPFFAWPGAIAGVPPKASACRYPRTRDKHIALVAGPFDFSGASKIQMSFAGRWDLDPQDDGLLIVSKALYPQQTSCYEFDDVAYDAYDIGVVGKSVSFDSGFDEVLLDITRAPVMAMRKDDDLRGTRRCIGLMLRDNNDSGSLNTTTQTHHDGWFFDDIRIWAE